MSGNRDALRVCYDQFGPTRLPSYSLVGCTDVAPKSHVRAVEGNPVEPQSPGAAEPQPKGARAVNRRDATTAETTQGERTVLKCATLAFCNAMDAEMESRSGYVNARH